MVTIKLILDVVLPGSQMVSKSELKGASKNKLRELTNHTSFMITYIRGDKKTKKPVKVSETLHVFTRNCIPAHQTINISLEAYQYMMSLDSCPNTIRPSYWKGLSQKQRLETHLKDYCKDLGGISYTYQILPD